MKCSIILYTFLIALNTESAQASVIFSWQQAPTGQATANAPQPDGNASGEGGLDYITWGDGLSGADLAISGASGGNGDAQASFRLSTLVGPTSFSVEWALRASLFTSNSGFSGQAASEGMFIINVELTESYILRISSSQINNGAGAVVGISPFFPLLSFLYSNDKGDFYEASPGVYTISGYFQASNFSSEFSISNEGQATFEFYQPQPKLSEVSIQAALENQPPMFTGTIANGPPLGSARLQASLDLGSTDPWADLVCVPLDAEGSATFTNIPDSRPQALGAQSNYFRVVTEPPPNQ
jgi:hypothetical protein